MRNFNGIYRTNGRNQDQSDYQKYIKRFIKEDLNKEYERNNNNKFTLHGEEIFDIDEEQNPVEILDIIKNDDPSYLLNKENLKDNLNKNNLNGIDFKDNRKDLFHKHHNNNYLRNKYSYENLNEDYGYPSYDDEMLDIITPKALDYDDLIYRREVSSNTINNRNLENSSLYPTVLTKALQISLNPSAPSHIGGSLLSNVAQQLNTSTLDLAKEITKSETTKNGDQFSQTVQSYLTNNNAVPTASNNKLNQPLIETKETLGENLPTRYEQNFKNSKEDLKNEETFDGITTSSLTEILDRVLNKLESIYDGKSNDYEDHPDGAPCDIIGSWSSSTLGLCFNIELAKDKLHDISPAEINNKLLTISIVECTPPKHHQIIDLDWKFTGSALKQLGGLFYLYGQKRSESVAATFLGFCRTCGGIDTIFGSWNSLFPSKDCNDISLAFDVKRDVLRRIRMEAKRKERFKELLYKSHHGQIP
ncbi:dual specificity protein kinase splB [Lucilia sericata]|uniref:dual specificity protein kinase splB n=1 Tax=Lucilia sericata TaxID=13632 RepID=UPI0018A877A7|nr:dual specificity protein kinase splB [Lucilia sericata]